MNELNWELSWPAEVSERQRSTSNHDSSRLASQTVTGPVLIRFRTIALPEYKVRSCQTILNSLRTSEVWRTLAGLYTSKTARWRVKRSRLARISAPWLLRNTTKLSLIATFSMVVFASSTPVPGQGTLPNTSCSTIQAVERKAG